MKLWNLLFIRQSAISLTFFPLPTQCGTNTQLLHVFQEDFILGYKPQKEEVHMPTFPYGEGVAHKIKLCSVIITSRKQ